MSNGTRLEPKHAPCRGRLAVKTGYLTLAAGLAAAVWWGLIAQGQVDKGILGNRQDRMDKVTARQETQTKADTEIWSPSKIILNLDARCPVVSTLGFFGAFATTDKDPAKTAELQARYIQLQRVAQPIAVELKDIAVSTSFVGANFPSSLALEQRLNGMRGRLFGEIVRLYGEAALAELQQYVAAQSQGVVVGRAAPAQ